MEASGSSEENLSSESTQLIDSIPSSPPPSYEHVLAESRLEGRENLSPTTDSSQEPDEHPKQIMIVHKSSKELYKALAAQWGITCKMSDHCRCYDCQSHYFDCEYDRDNEHEKTDGGLGAGTPMFISEVIHDSPLN
ncbi:uncharacterized protein isoform X2 [Rhodnius prolixus]|uniref:uncharacterized protein isoform X2 n=1 Tax=Rhodnius prolixus TaxID=13249 RepID=UPI003D18E7E4